mgnify:CR=1 FL=1
MTSEKTLDPAQWDYEFISTIIGENNLPVESYISTIETFGGTFDILQEIGISELSDLSGENVRAALDKFADIFPDYGADISEYFDEIEIIFDGLGFDKDPDFWTDKSQWTQTALEEKFVGMSPDMKDDFIGILGKNPNLWNRFLTKIVLYKTPFLGGRYFCRKFGP